MEVTETAQSANFLTSFKWSERSIALGVLLENYRLPQVVRVPRDHQVRVGAVHLGGDQHVLLGEARKVRRVVAQGVELRSFLPVGPKLSIPLDFRGRFLLLPLEGWQVGVRHFETVSELTASFPDKVFAKEDIHLDVFDSIVKTPDKKKVAKTFKHPIVRGGDVLTLLAVKKAYRVSKTTKKPKKGSSKAVDCLICANQKNERVALPISFPGKFVTVHTIEEIVKNYRLPVMVQLVQGQSPSVDNFTGVLTLMETSTEHSVQARLVSTEGEIEREQFKIPVIGKKVQLVPPEAMLLNTAEYKQNLADWLEGNWRGPPANGHVSNGSVLRETPRNGELMTVQATLHQEKPPEEVGRSPEDDLPTADRSSRVVSVDGSIYEYVEGSKPPGETPEVCRHVTLAEIVLEDSSTDPPESPKETIESSVDRTEGAPPAPDYPAPLPPTLTPDVAPPAPDYPAPPPPLQSETMAPLEAPPPVPDKPINIPERDYDPNPLSTVAPPPAQSEDKYGYMIPLDNDGLPVRDYPPDDTPSEPTTTSPLATAGGAALTSEILAMRQKILSGETKTEDTEDGQEDEDADDPDWEPPNDLTIMTPREVTKFLRLADIDEEAIQRFKAAGVDGKRLVGMPRDEMTDEFELTSQQSKDVFSFILESQIATKL
ncbi:GRB2-associated and regulator of MAPK protein 1-like [Branchiostoma lanceolatum]|uniref:GRB2-associated and regulator of MAPK protein 1-like n=1 Tax=Branchiostoma lanceolatum TaxID=7740 RepID=UPI003457331C